MVYAALVATHYGEFWPFSIYPMFSQGGSDWSRTVVREIEDVDDVKWAPTAVSELPGVAYPLTPNGVDPIDLASFISKTHVWDEDRKLGLQSTFLPVIGDKRLLVFKVDGRISPTDSVLISFEPHALVTRESVVTNPRFGRE